MCPLKEQTRIGFFGGAPDSKNGTLNEPANLNPKPGHIWHPFPGTQVDNLFKGLGSAGLFWTLGFMGFSGFEVVGSVSLRVFREWGFRWISCVGHLARVKGFCARFGTNGPPGPF